MIGIADATTPGDTAVLANRSEDADLSARRALPPTLTALAVLAFGGSAVAADLESGRGVGDPIPEFYTRVVTGPLMNKSVCYVCRNGTRPVVMVFVRDTSAPVQRLLRNVDILVDRHRGDGLRSFGVYLSAVPSQRDVSRVQTFAFEGRVKMPLVVAPEEVASAGQQNVHSEAAVTVVCYRNRRCEHRMALRADELDVEHLRPVLKRVLEFAEGPTTEAVE